MHKLLEYVCDELKKLEKKADSGDKLSLSEIQYGDTLAHFKKNLLTADAMMDEYGDGSSYARGRDTYGRYRSRGSYDDGYSRDSMDELTHGLRELERNAQDAESKRMIRKWMEQIEK